MTRRGPDRDDGYALLMSLGLVALLATTTLTMLAVVLQQVRPTAQARKDIGSVNAATSGLQAGLAVLRVPAATRDANGLASRADLPCSAAQVTTFRDATTSVSTSGAVLTGQPAATLPGGFGYAVSIAYYGSDPTDQPLGWLQANALTCPLTATPLYAYLQSYGTGTDPSGTTGSRGNRAQVAVYRFSVPAANVAGGRLRSYGTSVCLDAGDTPAVGSALFLRTCLAAGTARQTWQYRSDLTLFYGGSSALNLCVQGTTSAPPTLQTCTGTGDGPTFLPSVTPHYATGQQPQLWSFNDNGHFSAANDDGTVSSSCAQPATSGPDAQLTVYACTGSVDDFRAFDPDPAVGAGKAGGNTTGLPGSPTNQLVNFEEFGRCLDVTGASTTSTFLIAYPCKQAPDSTTLRWNQVWTWTGGSSRVGSLRTAAPSTGGAPAGDYCLTEPAATSSSVFVVVALCDSTRGDQTWNATGDVAGSAATSYTVVARSGRCLSLGGTRTGYGSLQITVETCNGANRQRWNAPPPQPPAGLSNVQEGSPAP